MESAWVSVISASAALLGVALGQLLQGRREELRWKRERELDNERREDQRQRDREMWAREDRNRFTEQKRQVYVDYQACAYRLSVLIVDAASAQSDSPDAPDGGDVPQQFIEMYNELKMIRNNIRLVAPVQVVASVTQVDEVLIPAASKLRERNPEIVRGLWRSLRSARLDLFDSMRRDLDPASGLLGDGETTKIVPHAKAETWPT